MSHYNATLTPAS